MVVTSPPTSSNTSLGGGPNGSVPAPTALRVGDGDEISRLVFTQLIAPGVDKFVLQPLFEFPTAGGRIESVIWRNVVPADPDVHEMGCAKETNDRAKGKRREYRGFRTATAGDVRSRKTRNGHGFLVYHSPQEGPAHVHVKVELAADASYGKNDRQDVRALIEQAFLSFSPHSCAA